jgi:hypothetical protein
MEPAENLADALVQICADYLSTGAEPPASPGQAADPGQAGVSAETPDPQRQTARPGARRRFCGNARTL